VAARSDHDCAPEKNSSAAARPRRSSLRSGRKFTMQSSVNTDPCRRCRASRPLGSRRHFSDWISWRSFSSGAGHRSACPRSRLLPPHVVLPGLTARSPLRSRAVPAMVRESWLTETRGPDLDHHAFGVSSRRIMCSGRSVRGAAMSGAPPPWSLGRGGPGRGLDGDHARHRGRSRAGDNRSPSGPQRCPSCAGGPKRRSARTAVGADEAHDHPHGPAVGPRRRACTQ